MKMRKTMKHTQLITEVSKAFNIFQVVRIHRFASFYSRTKA